jgi:putative hydrolase of the HAD superfamily
LPSSGDEITSLNQPVRAVLFDLGNTLAAYYHADAFRPVLEDCVRSVLGELARRGRGGVGFEQALETALAQNQEAADFRVRPLAPRLATIFAVEMHDRALLDALSTAFLEPIFAMGRCFDDALPVLARLRAAGLRTAIVSNSPWGSPAQLWRQEVQRLRLLDAVDVTVFCEDVGWRKPAKLIFERAAQLLRVAAEQCCFVGDDPRWDAEGAANAGMRPLLLDRDGRHARTPWLRVGTLEEVVEELRIRQNGPS